MANDRTVEMIEAVVSKVGSYGFCVEGREGWVSISKFADPRPELPGIGQRVKVSLDRSGYAREIAVVPTAAYAGGYAAVASAPRGECAPVDRDTRIMREAVLNAAIATLSAGGQMVEPSAALQLAEVYEGWVLR